MLELRLADFDLDRCRCFFFLQLKLITDFKEKFILLLRFDSKHVVLVVAKLKFRGFSEAIEALIAVEGSTRQSPSRLAPKNIQENSLRSFLTFCSWIARVSQEFSSEAMSILRLF